MGIGASAPQVRPVVVGVDGSRTTRGTVDLAAAEAVRRRTGLAMVHVWPGRHSGVFGARSALSSPADGGGCSRSSPSGPLDRTSADDRH